MSDSESSTDVSAAPEDNAHAEPPAQAPARPDLPQPNAAPPWERLHSRTGSAEEDSAAERPASSAAPRGPAGYYGIDASTTSDDDQARNGRSEFEPVFAPANEQRTDDAQRPRPASNGASSDEDRYAPPPSQSPADEPGQQRWGPGPTEPVREQQDRLGDGWAGATDEYSPRDFSRTSIAPSGEGATPSQSAQASRPGNPWVDTDPGPRPGPSQWAAPSSQTGGPGRGDAGNWSYVDQIRSSELVPTRKVPPSRGWRRVLFRTTFGLINLGQSPDERREAELEAKVRTVLRGRYKIGVLGKGGTGKTTIAACVGSLFARLRQDDRVVAIDADTAFGKLATRIDPRTSGSYWELISDRQLNTFADMRTRVGNNSAGLFVLAGETSTARRRALDPATYREAAARLDSHFTISIIDCGTTMDSPVMQAVLADLDALIIVSSTWVDGASAAGQTLDWLAERGYTGLLHRTVVVLNDSDGHADAEARAELAGYFSKHGQAVIQLPFDRHLRPGGVMDIDNELDRVTRRRILEIAATIAEHFPSTTDAPRGHR
ncbi:ATPase involved in chromosome partitioning (plasmid) [Mycobacterium sp. JS623]|uniref:nucleotide-binding protein n=1 Tax=Mycobacterium sp. JS623 TaxID=212767 RepID=UPI0002A5A213|nr:ATPase involved in chromosome partitioning [Mycobacterium sp. JS623]AGB26836.1 ATPase involved in chromosome partitioning [Mycobacterium sp. JS623]